MVIAKDKILNLIDHMPDMIQVDELIERIVISQKVEIGLQQIKEGKIVTEEELDKLIDSWE